jgi:hypothetical protein
MKTQAKGIKSTKSKDRNRKRLCLRDILGHILSGTEREERITPDRGTTGQRREVKLPRADQRFEQSPAVGEGKSRAELWGRIWGNQNVVRALERV